MIRPAAAFAALTLAAAVSATAFGDEPAAPRADVSLEALPDAGSASRWSRERRTLVVSLLTPEETGRLGFDYPVDVMSQGMTYANVPVGQMTGPEAADALAAILAQADGPVVIHCGTSVRASHLYAASLIRSGALRRDELSILDPGRSWNEALIDRLTGETQRRESGENQD